MSRPICFSQESRRKMSLSPVFALIFPAPAGIIEHGSICQFRHFAACWRFWEPAPFAARPRGNAPMGEGSRYIWIPGTNAPRAVLRPQTAPCAARTRRCRSSSPAAQGGSGQDAQTDLTAPDAASAQDGQAGPSPQATPTAAAQIVQPTAEENNGVIPAPIPTPDGGGAACPAGGAQGLYGCMYPLRRKVLSSRAGNRQYKS